MQRLGISPFFRYINGPDRSRQEWLILWATGMRQCANPNRRLAVAQNKVQYKRGMPMLEFFDLCRAHAHSLTKWFLKCT